MSADLALSRRVVAIIGTGSDLDRAIAVACAEAGADLALGTESDHREHEYGMNSIANEIWAIGREHFACVLRGPNEVSDFVAEARARLGGCDALVCQWEIDGVEGVPVVRAEATAAETVRAVVRAIQL